MFLDVSRHLVIGHNNIDIISEYVTELNKSMGFCRSPAQWVLWLSTGSNGAVTVDKE